MIKLFFEKSVDRDKNNWQSPQFQEKLKYHERLEHQFVSPNTIELSPLSKELSEALSNILNESEKKTKLEGEPISSKKLEKIIELLSHLNAAEKEYIRQYLVRFQNNTHSAPLRRSL